MFNQNSTWAWGIVIGLAVFILALNFGLLWGIKEKVKKDNWVNKVKDAGEVLKHPMKNENDQLNALSEQVQKFKINERFSVNEKQQEAENREHEGIRITPEELLCWLFWLSFLSPAHFLAASS